jgi:molecular chaperone HtpG
MSRLKGILTNQVNRKLTSLAKKDPETYLVFWDEFGQFIKEGVASDEKRREALIPLLRFKTTTHPKEWTSLDEYLARMPDNQEKIYYILGDDAHSVSRSPHLDYFQSHCYEVLILTDPVDSFMVMGLRDQDDYELQNVAASDLELPSPREETEKTDQGDEQEEMSSGEADRLVERFKAQLGEQVSDVRTTTRLTSSAARLVDPEGALGQEMQRMYRMMDRDFQIPAKVLELNPAHPIMGKLAGLDQGDPLSKAIIEQIYENAMLIEGIHPDPASMISRIDDLMEAALEK